MTRKRVVLAEDYAPMAQQLKALLTSHYDVEIASDGRALIGAVEAGLPDVILSDISMPEIDGLAAARIILASHPEARIVFVTVRDEPAVIKAALAGGARGYVVKCDAGDELLDVVNAVLAGQTFVSTIARAALEREKSGRLP